MVSTEGRQAVQNNSPGESGARVPGKERGKTVPGGGSAPGLVPGHFPAFDPIGSSSCSSVSTPIPHSLAIDERAESGSAG